MVIRARITRTISPAPNADHRNAVSGAEPLLESRPSTRFVLSSMSVRLTAVMQASGRGTGGGEEQGEGVGHGGTRLRSQAPPCHRSADGDVVDLGDGLGGQRLRQR